MPLQDQEYAWARIEHAFEEADKNLAKAQRLLLSWAEVDDDLLRGLAEPHLKSLIGYALQQIVADDIDEAELPVDIPKPIKENTKKKTLVGDDQMEIGAFGLELLQNMTGGKHLQNFGFVTDDMDAPQKASKDHVDAILQLAKTKSE